MAPPIVLLHGLATSSARTWGETGWLDLLADAGRVTIALDLPGHGTARTADASKLVDGLEAGVLAGFPAEPVDVIGFSLGARILLTIACEHPERFNRIVVAGVGANLFTDDPARSERIMTAVGGVEDPEDPEARHFYALAESTDIHRETLVALMRAPRPTLTADAVRRISCPVLVVLGDDDFAGPADPLVDALADPTFKTLRNTDHFATPKSFDFIDAALEFLDAAPC